MKIKQYRTSFLDHLFFASFLIIPTALITLYIHWINPTIVASVAAVLFVANWLTSGVSVMPEMIIYKRNILSKTRFIPMATLDELRSSQQKAIDSAVGNRSDWSLTLSFEDRDDVRLSNMPAGSVAKIIDEIIEMKHATVRKTRVGTSDRYQLH